LRARRRGIDVRGGKKGTEAPLDLQLACATETQVEKIIRLLALLAIKGESQAEKIKILSGAGFSNTEIAALLGLTANAVNVALHRLRTKK
jgi:DNA-directed RNA polymerase specialized sigma24 family protein